MNIQLVLSMKVYLFACYWSQRISVLASGVQRMSDFVKQGLHFPRVHDGPAHGLSWEWFELTGAQLSELLKEKAQRCREASLLSVVGTGEQCSSPCKRAAWCPPGPYPPLSLQGRATLLMKCSVLVSTGPSWPLNHLLVSAWAFGEHNAGWLSFLAASVCFCNYFIALTAISGMLRWWCTRPRVRSLRF